MTHLFKISTASIVFALAISRVGATSLPTGFVKVTFDEAAQVHGGDCLYQGGWSIVCGACANGSTYNNWPVAGATGWWGQGGFQDYCDILDLTGCLIWYAWGCDTGVFPGG